MTTIFLADDHAVVRDGLRLVLETEPDFQVIGQAGNGREAVRLVAQNCPDVIIMDIGMPELNGIEATRQIYETCPETKVIILSMHTANKLIFRALQAGAQGYVLKSSVGAEVIDAVRSVRDGRRYLSQKVSEVVIDDYISQTQDAVSQNILDYLSPREYEILKLVVEGKSSAEIGDILQITPSSVDTYRSRLMHKLNVNNVPELVKLALQHGLTTLE